MSDVMTTKSEERSAMCNMKEKGHNEKDHENRMYACCTMVTCMSYDSRIMILRILLLVLTQEECKYNPVTP